jgi:hypothetical protein
MSHIDLDLLASHAFWIFPLRGVLVPIFQPVAKSEFPKPLSLSIILMLSIALLASGCGGGVSGMGTSPTPTPTPIPAGEWTYMSGSSTSGAEGVYVSINGGLITVPGARIGAVSWADSSGNLWLFGGVGFDSAGTDGELNDLWEYNHTNPLREWTWISGSETANAVGVYGTQGIAAASNVPGARQNAVSWIDSSGNLWLFGGSFPSGGGNDLWEFNPSTKEWTWVSGSNTTNAMGVYGTQGVASAANVPGARSLAVAWTDKSGNFWLFGGDGYDSTGRGGELNDLWEFSPSAKEWTWVSGSQTANAVGVYGTQGVAAASNVPGARIGAVSWADSSGNLWLFGGADNGYLNDLWEFNPTTREWKWVSGNNTANATGIYGTRGVAAASNVPGGRDYAVSWIDSSGSLWLFGGQNQNSYFNDLWNFNPSIGEWTWVSGNSYTDGPGSYGTQGTASTSNLPGARYNAVAWIDSSGNLWLFGGGGFPGLGNFGYLNDLWRYQP